MKSQRPHKSGPLIGLNNNRNYGRERLFNFGVTMIVMSICFPLYYLGLFGNVEGPLQPARLGERLASMGVSKTHMLALFLSFLIISVTWNWIYNLVSLLIGSRLICFKKVGHEGAACGGAELVRSRERGLFLAPAPGAGRNLQI